MTGLRIAAIMAVHNRRDLTLACLDSLRAQRLPDGTLDVFVLDDASTDGTAAAVLDAIPKSGCSEAMASSTGTVACGGLSARPWPATTTTTSG